MADEKLFRKTPFNGYNRDDVLQYLTDADLRQKEKIAAYQDQIQALKEAAGNGLAEKLREEKNRLAEKIGTLRKQAEEERSAATESESKEQNPAVFQLKKDLTEARNELTDLTALCACLAKNEAKTDDYRAFQKELEELRAQDPRTEELRETVAGQEEQIRQLTEQNETLQNAQAEWLAAKVRLSETELRVYEEKEQVRALEKLIEEKDEKIRGIEEAWEESKQKFLSTQKEQEAAGMIVTEAEAKAEAIIAEAETERQKRLEAINTEIKNILSGAVRESEKIIAAANEKAEIIIKNANLSAAEAMRKLTPMKESLSSILSAIQTAEQPPDDPA